MHSTLKRITSGIIAYAVVLGSLVVCPKTNREIVNAASLGEGNYISNKGYYSSSDSASTVNYSTVLGRATSYGVVADSWEQVAHAETNFAVNSYSNSDGAKLEPDLAGSAPLSFVVGNITSGQLLFGGATYNSDPAKYVIHASQALKDDYDAHQIENSDEYKQAKITVNDINGKVSLSVDNLYTANTVTNMINHVKTESDALKAKSSTIDIEAYEASHSVDENNYVIDLNVEDYKDQVVYINVPQGTKLANIFSSSDGYLDSVRIIKYSSTIVVFNFIGWNTVYAKGTLVNVVDSSVTIPNDIKKTYNGTDYIDTKTLYKADNSNSSSNKLVEDEIVDKIIFNMPDAATVGFRNAAGAFLAPNATQCDILATSSGWLVTGGALKNTGGEWHFLNGNRADSLFFSGQKKFTRSYTTYESTTPELELIDDKSISYEAGDFEFELYESNAGYELGNKLDTAVVTDSGSFTFKPLENLVSGETYYYVIKENSSKTIDGITNSDGEIDIKLEVITKTNNEIGYLITSSKYLTQADKAAGNAFRTNDQTPAQELEFYFGSVYNLVTTNQNTETPITVYISKREINVTNGDEVPGATLEIEYLGNDNSVDLTTVSLNRSGSPIYPTDLSTKKITFESGSEQTAFVGLKPGNYSLKETIAPDGFQQQTTTINFTIGDDGKVTATSPIDSSVGSIRNDNIVIILNERDTATTGYIDITKTFGGDVDVNDFKNLTFSLYKDDGTFVKTFDFNDSTFTKDGDTYKLKEKYKVNTAQQYYVVEENYDIYNDRAVSVTYKLPNDASATTVADGKSSNFSAETGNDINNPYVIAFTNTYETRNTASLVISKTINLPSGTNLSAINPIKFTIDPAINGTGEITLTPGNPESGWTKTDNKFTYSFSGLKQGDSYTVTESSTDDGSNSSYDVTVDPTGRSVTVDLPASKTAKTEGTAAFTNTYTTTTTNNGEIVLTKTIEGPVTEEDLSLGINGIQFDVYEGDSTTSCWTHLLGETGHFTKGTDADGNTTYTAHITGLDTSKTYKVVESKQLVDGYNVVVTYSIDGVSSGSGVTATGINPVTTGTAVDFKDVYTRLKGTLTVDKELSGVTGNDTKAFTFIVKVGTNEGYIQADGKIGTTAHEFTVTPGTDCDVPVDYSAFGKTLTVEELDTDRGITGYTFSKVDYEDNGQKISTSGDVKTTTITNTYTTTTTNNGEIVLTKTIEGPVTEEDLSLGINGIQFDVYEGDSTTSCWTHLLGETGHFTKGTDADGNTTYTAHITGLDTSKTYKVVESKQLVDGYNVVVTYSIDGVSSGSGVTATGINPVTTGTAVDFKDVYTRLKGTLTVDKELSGVTGNDTKAFTFIVKVGTNEGYIQADGKIGTTAHEFTVTPGTDCDVPVDYSAFGKTLTVEELDTDRGITGYTFSKVDYEDNGQKISTNGDVKTTTITNTYTTTPPAEKGYIDITKTFGGEVKASDFVNLEFDLYSTDDKTNPVTKFKFNDTTFEWDDVDKKYVLITKYEVTDLTKEYFVVEKNYDIYQDKDVSVTYSLDGGAATSTANGESGTFTVDKTYTATSPYAVAFVNDYKPKTTPPVEKGYLDITKTFGGEVTASDFVNLEFDLYSTDDKTTPVKVFKFNTANFVWDGDKFVLKTKYEVADLTKEYYVVEKNYDIYQDKDVSVTYSLNGGSATAASDGESGTFKVDKSYTETSPYVVSFVNEYTPNTPPPEKKAYIDITKTFGGYVTGEDFDNLTFEIFEVGNPTAVATYLFGLDFEESSANLYCLKTKFEVTDLTKEYYVVETNYDVNAQKQVSVSYSLDGSANTVGDKTGTFTVNEADTENYPYVVAFTNEYVPTTLLKTKGNLTISKSFGVNAPAGTDTMVFTFSVTGPNGYTNTVSITGKGSYTLTDLEPGSYTVTEDATGAAIANYELTVSGEGTVEVVAGGESVCAVINTYIETNTAPDKGSLTISKSLGSNAPDDAFTKTYTFIVTSTDGYNNTVTITGAGSATLDNLDPGTYTVTEDSKDAEIAGFTLDVSGDNGVAVSVEAGKAATCSITNSYDIPEKPVTPEEPKTPSRPEPPVTTPPVTTTDDHNPPITTDDDDENPPVTTTDDNNPPVTTTDDHHPPVTRDDDDDEDDHYPPVTRDDDDEDEDDHYPPVDRKGKHRYPPVITTPPVTTTNEHNPPVTTTPPEHNPPVKDHPPVPATGEKKSYYALAGTILLGMCAAIVTGLGLYRKKNSEE